jgi:hypothetical protein
MGLISSPVYFSRYFAIWEVLQQSGFEYACIEVLYLLVFAFIGAFNKKRMVSIVTIRLIMTSISSLHEFSFAWFHFI